MNGVRRVEEKLDERFDVLLIRKEPVYLLIFLVIGIQKPSHPVIKLTSEVFISIASPDSPELLIRKIEKYDGRIVREIFPVELSK